MRWQGGEGAGGAHGTGPVVRALGLKRMARKPPPAGRGAGAATAGSPATGRAGGRAARWRGGEGRGKNPTTPNPTTTAGGGNRGGVRCAPRGPPTLGFRCVAPCSTPKQAGARAKAAGCSLGAPPVPTHPPTPPHHPFLSLFVASLSLSAALSPFELTILARVQADAADGEGGPQGLLLEGGLECVWGGGGGERE